MYFVSFIHGLKKHDKENSPTRKKRMALNMDSTHGMKQPNKVDKFRALFIGLVEILLSNSYRSSGVPSSPDVPLVAPAGARPPLGISAPVNVMLLCDPSFISPLIPEPSPPYDTVFELLAVITLYYYLRYT